MTEKRDSQTHPLRIDTIHAPTQTFVSGGGLIGVTFCPGKKQPDAATGAWDRDLRTDIEAIVEWSDGTPVTLVSLLERDEFGTLGVDIKDLKAMLQEHEMAWLHLSIADGHAPDVGFEMRWHHAGPNLLGELEDGHNVVVHCKGRLGRAGTVAARLLIEMGMSVEDAMDEVRQARPSAIETRTQEQYLHSLAGLPDKAPGRGVPGSAFGSRRDALANVAFGERLQTEPGGFVGKDLPWPLELARASLIGGMYGDAVGAETEFMTLPEILRATRPLRPTNEWPREEHFENTKARRAEYFTDDTQMTLFTLEGIARAVLRGRTRGIGANITPIVHRALLRWLETQKETPAEVEREGIMKLPSLHMRRAPGMTCLTALRDVDAIGEPSRNDSKGCGTIMRVAPVALLLPRDWVRTVAVETSALTHGHPTGQLAAAAWAEMLADVADGEPLEAVAHRTADAYANLEGGAETAAAIRAALEAPRDGKPSTVEAFATVEPSKGPGWVAEECLAVALYACLCTLRDLPADEDRGDPFMDGVDIAVTHGGDSDSTAAVAGNMLGLMYPHLATERFKWKLFTGGVMAINGVLSDYAAIRGEYDTDFSKMIFLAPS